MIFVNKKSNLYEGKKSSVINKTLYCCGFSWTGLAGDSKLYEGKKSSVINKTLYCCGFSWTGLAGDSKLYDMYINLIKIWPIIKSIDIILKLGVGIVDTVR